MSTCSQCGTRYPGNVKFCTRDGAVLEDDAPSETDQVGKVLAGKYRLDAYLSKGGMGSVFRATHLMLEKQVALKVIKPELVGSSEFVRRFQREARAATSLNHPNIVGVYDLGQAEDGTLYIAMELVDGANLKEVIRRSGPMDSIRIVRIVRQILSALALAHRHHIVHRDLKPQNIMLTTDRDGNEIAKLVDFGIAKTFDDRTQLTGTGFAIGTPQYMAPEQAAGTEVDGRSDLYSLGIILYEMLVAEVPFNAPSTPAILVKHLTEVPVRPSERRKDVAVHRGLEDVAVRCLEKDRANRFQTAEDVAQAIAAAVSLDEGAASVSEAATLPMHAPHLSMASTRTAAPVPQAFDSSMAPTMQPPSAQPAAPAPTVLDPAPAVSGPGDLAAAATVVPSAPTATGAPSAPTMRPTAVAPPPPPAGPASSAGASSVAAAPALTAAPPPASMSQPPPVVKTGRNSLALGVGALAIVALAGMGFAIQRFGGTPAVSAPPSAAPAAAVTPGQPADPPPASAAAPAPGAGAVDPQSSGATPQQSAESRDPSAAAPPPAAVQSASSGDRGTPPLPGREAADPARQMRQTAARTPAAGAAREPVAPPREPAAPPPAPAAPPVPQLAEHPTVLMRCDGAPEICGAVRDAFASAFDRERMPLTSSAQRADVYVVVTAAALEGRVEQQFGTTFATRTYAINVELEAPRLDSAPSAPQSRTFSADLRVGRERVAENARLVAMDTVLKIREFWTRRRAAGE